VVRGSWFVAGGWWLVAGGWWLVAGGFPPPSACPIADAPSDAARAVRDRWQTVDRIGRTDRIDRTGSTGPDRPGAARRGPAVAVPCADDRCTTSAEHARRRGPRRRLGEGRVEGRGHVRRCRPLRAHRDAGRPVIPIPPEQTDTPYARYRNVYGQKSDDRR
jgi:hypothetical protein